MQISFSIITVTYNSKDQLLKTINSVQTQSYKNFTHIIKDGLSKDNTNKIDFRKYLNIKFYESKDNGVYDAMNQALNFASNEYIIYLNSGDVFFSRNTLNNLANLINKHPNNNCYIGGTIQIDSEKNNILRLMGIGFLYKFLPLVQLPHPSLIIRKSTLKQLKIPFDPTLKIASDYKQQLILRKKNLFKIYHSNLIVSLMPIGGISNINKFSILYGYKETLIFSFRLFNILCLYIIFLKIILNLYSKLMIYKIRYLKIFY